MNISEKVVSLLQLTGMNVNIVGLSGCGQGLSIENGAKRIIDPVP